MFYVMHRHTWSVWLRDQKFMSLCNCILCMRDYELCVCDMCPCCPTPDSQGTTVEAPHVAPWILPLGRQKSGISKAQGLMEVYCRPVTSCGLI